MKRGTKRKLTSDNHHRHHSTTAVTTTTADPGRMCRRFIHQGQLYDTIYDAHRAVCHGEEKRTYFEVSKTIANVTQQSVKLFISLCHICNLKRLPRRKKGVIRPIVSASFAERGQMDLINMQQEGGCVYKYILHSQDHLTKFSVLRALRSKRAIEVARHLLDIFALLGAPRILQSDNGREFVAEVIQELSNEMWPNMLLINSKPRHPQSQGSIERANGDVIKMLDSWMCENQTRDWSAGLPFVQFTKNTAYSRGIGISPYKAVFGIEPRIVMKIRLSPSIYSQLFNNCHYDDNEEEEDKEDEEKRQRSK
nr:KRAB-A domain-containing protein 2-like [Procambarus clarkii]